MLNNQHVDCQEDFVDVRNTNKRSMRVKLIFNPISGANSESPVQLMDIIKQLQAWKLVPEPYLIEPESDLKKVVIDAIAQGIKMIIVCGGDGTVSSAARAIIGTTATLGIIPTGTQNNVAMSLGIPTDIPSAIAMLRTGVRSKIDIGICTYNGETTPFIEVCSVGLFSTLFSSADDIQHGNIARVGDFLTTLATTPPSEIQLQLENKKEIHKLGHLVIISNMPYIVRHYQVGSIDSLKDGLLDVLFFAGLSKMDLLGYLLKGPGTSKNEDPRIQHFRVRSISIKTNPAMPIMIDGISIGDGSVRLEAKRRGMNVMVAREVSNESVKPGDTIGK